jgi:hypothetical protein
MDVAGVMEAATDESDYDAIFSAERDHEAVVEVIPQLPVLAVHDEAGAQERRVAVAELA